ncbi:MAG: GNAT family N-acetyltransferase, partial [Phaeodactylibacter sp.]|nr:GNAT family N-acetyltransferase [Phaeodactylibacter sp.]
MLGAAVASVQLHNSDAILPIQQKVADLVEFTNNRIEALGLPQFEVTHSPLFFIPAGLPKVTTGLVSRMIGDGFFVNSAGFPATPMKRGGVRFMVNGNLEKEDFAQMLDALAYHYPRVIEEEGCSLEQVARFFHLPEIKIADADDSIGQAAPQETDLQCIVENSINAIDPTEWDAIMAERGNFTHSSLKMLEYVFSNKNEPENNWNFEYFKVLDHNTGDVILNTFYTTAILKDDMFSPASISQQLETLRKEDPFYLTTKTVLLGSPITKGSHLFLNREHPQWKAALELLIEQMHKKVESTKANQLMLREFRKDADPELKRFLMDHGLIEVDVLDECRIEDMSWKDHDEYLQRLGGKYRYNVRKEILPFVDEFDVVTERPQSPEEIRICYDLYCNVWEQAFEMNVYRLPYSYFESICHHPEYDIIRLYRKGTDTPVGVMFSHRRDKNYQALIVGLDYRFVRSMNTYKQMLYQTVWRAWELGCEQLDLAFTAELEKKKVGARPEKVCIYVQSMDHFNHAVLSTMTQAALVK